MVQKLGPASGTPADCEGIAPNLKGRLMNLGEIVSELKKERDDLNRAIAALEGIGGKQPGTSKISGKPSTAKISKRGRSGISAAGRKRLSEAMKKRWQERRAKVTPVRKPSKAA